MEQRGKKREVCNDARLSELVWIVSFDKMEVTDVRNASVCLTITANGGKKRHIKYDKIFYAKNWMKFIVVLKKVWHIFKIVQILCRL